MAITRAQQFKQMLREGGRTGFFLGSSYDLGSEEDKKRDIKISRDEAAIQRQDDDAGMPAQDAIELPKTEKPKPKKPSKKKSFIESFNEKKRAKNQQYLKNIRNKKFEGIAAAYGLSTKQMQELLDAYNKDEDEFSLSDFRAIVDAGAPPGIISSDPNFLKAQELQLSKKMAKGNKLSTGALFNTTDPTTRIELPSLALQKLQGEENFSNMLSGLNRLQTLDEIINQPGGVKTSDINNYFNLTMGKGGIDPVTGEEVPALFRVRDDPSPQQVADPCKGPNPPAYCFIGKNAETTTADPSSVFAQSGITPRIAGSQFAADGGRAGFFLGGNFQQSEEQKQRDRNISREEARRSRDDDSPQQTTAKPSGGIPAANIFDEAARRAGFQLIDPKKRQLFAELINYQKLPQAGEKFNPSFDIGFFGDKLEQRFEDEKKRRKDLNLPTETKGAFVDMIESGALGAGTSTLFDENVGKLFEGVPLDASFFSTEVGDVNPTFITREGGGGDIDIRRDQLSDPSALPEDFFRQPQAEGGMIDDNLPVLAAEGGIMDLGRQELFLGGIAKGLKKAARGVSRTLKKVAKSPIGKAALLYAATGGLGNLAAGKGFGSMFTNFTNPAKFLGGASKIFTKGGLQNIASRIGLGSFENIGGERIFKGINPLLAIGGVSALSGLLTKKGDDDDEDEFLRQYYNMRLDPSLSVRGTGSEFDFYKPQFVADGGRIEYQEGSKEPVAKKTMPLLDMDGQEMDLRAEGGFVPIGRMEKADDVPARLSKNEFVFTADAVRNAGDGDVDKGAEVMYNMMKNLERGGNVSDESQGLEGAREMFQTSQRLEEVL